MSSNKNTDPTYFYRQLNKNEQGWDTLLHHKIENKSGSFSLPPLLHQKLEVETGSMCSQF